jgi:hypothetical protein
MIAPSSSSMNTFTVITSIFHPTTAILEFSKHNSHKVVVVGDKKTPENWFVDGVDFLSVARQETLEFSLQKNLPFNHYSRKMIGYLYAMRHGAEIIVDTDDDNIPKSSWEFPKFFGRYETIHESQGFINIYSFFTDLKIWPRGYPLRLIQNKSDVVRNTSLRDVEVGIWQGLADEDPDVDAIYRLTSNEPCFFNKRAPIVLDSNTVTPFNSQNTQFRKELFPLLYLPAHVTFRFTDILRGLVAQPIMWNAGYRLGFTDATVIQKRNPHDYVKDFESEVPMFLQGEQALEIVVESIKASDDVSSNLHRAYSALWENKIVDEKEMNLLDLWLKDLQQLNYI